MRRHYYEGEARTRYCIDGCGSHTREPLRSFIHERDDGSKFDVNDALLCPWCAEKEAGLNTMSIIMTGNDNKKDWIRGE